jgi:hypothetical protein
MIYYYVYFNTISITIPLLSLSKLVGLEAIEEDEPLT